MPPKIRYLYGSSVPKSQILALYDVQRDIKNLQYCLKSNWWNECFLELDKIDCTNLKESLINKKVCPVVAFLSEKIFAVQSSNYPSLYVANLQDTCSLSVILAACPKTVNTVDTWSTLEEINWYLNFMAFDHKKHDSSQHFQQWLPK